MSLVDAEMIRCRDAVRTLPAEPADEAAGEPVAAAVEAVASLRLAVDNLHALALRAGRAVLAAKADAVGEFAEHLAADIETLARFKVKLKDYNAVGDMPRGQKKWFASIPAGLDAVDGRIAPLRAEEAASAVRAVEAAVEAADRRRAAAAGITLAILLAALAAALLACRSTTRPPKRGPESTGLSASDRAFHQIADDLTDAPLAEEIDIDIDVDVAEWNDESDSAGG